MVSRITVIVGRIALTSGVGSGSTIGNANFRQLPQDQSSMLGPGASPGNGWAGARRECAFRKTGPILAGYAPRSAVTAAAAKCPSSRGSPSLLALNSPGAMAARSAALVKDALRGAFFSSCATNFTAATPGCGQY